MAAHAITTRAAISTSPSERELPARIRAGLLAVWAAVTGTAPHVLHHVGPLAGSALVAGAGSRLAFGAVGFVATIPTLRRLQRRTGSWPAPALALGAFAAVFTFSTLVIGPVVSGSDEPAPVTDTTAETIDHHGHDVTGNGA